ncbi:MAG: hypothetical protein KKF65_03075 [Nanoarchaeota archaeon]|nr:hypothetical protein [Nanoarchaeota archaeon]
MRTKLESLKEILDELDLLNSEKNAIKSDPESKEIAQKVFYELLKQNTSFPNKQIISLYAWAKSTKGQEHINQTLKREGIKEFIDSFFPSTETFYKLIKGIGWCLDEFVQGYFFGAMTRSDQEAAALVCEQKPRNLSLKNTVVSYMVLGQYYVYGKTIGIAADMIPEVKNSGHWIGLFGVALIGVGNAVRTYLTVKNDTSYASWGLDGLWLNASTYFKRHKTKKKLINEGETDLSSIAKNIFIKVQTSTYK